ncbi:hypothetical protein Lxx18700 [Leifsonia xyli subsp. xyli str. CTCB07]|uniref:Uncharacterized protein n=1 Tax=Leifsonia xyli subsp. xyli (strain CTCB07) TaxID=281090 RepID=Q6ADE3_LEIXX|nr:hypothetical protein Lxx18700 [Leifsonia xyli subsp. xyli str. CTCB07]
MPVLTATLRSRLASVEPAAEEILSVLAKRGLAAETLVFGEPALRISGVDADPASAVSDDAWLALAEYRRVGADLELATLYADRGDWAELSCLVRRRCAELLCSPERAAEIVSRIPASVFDQDAWLIVVERTLGAEAGIAVPPRRLKKPAGAMPAAERAWLQAGKLRMEIADGSFTKAVAEAGYLTRIFGQADLPEDETAELWLQSALPPFHTGNYAEAAQRLEAALGLAGRADRRHVELAASGLLALCHALRGRLPEAETVIERILPSELSGNEGTVWSVPGFIASGLISAERGNAAGQSAVAEWQAGLGEALDRFR